MKQSSARLEEMKKEIEEHAIVTEVVKRRSEEVEEMKSEEVERMKRRVCALEKEKEEVETQLKGNEVRLSALLKELEGAKEESAKREQTCRLNEEKIAELQRQLQEQLQQRAEEEITPVDVKAEVKEEKSVPVPVEVTADVSPSLEMPLSYHHDRKLNHDARLNRWEEGRE